MADKNAIGVAMDLAKTKYADNPIIESLRQSVYNAQTLAHYSGMSYDHLAAYRKGLQGDKGYSVFLSQDDIKDAMGAIMKDIRYLVDAFAKADCLIMALKALGEDIDY